MHRNNLVDLFYTKENQLSWFPDEPLGEEVYDHYVDDLSEEWVDSRTYASRDEYWVVHEPTHPPSPYSHPDGSGDDYPWSGVQETYCTVPLPRRVRTPTKSAFFVRCLHQPAGASLCGDEFFTLRDSLIVHEIREMCEEEKAFLRFALRRLKANRETNRYIRQPEFRFFSPKDSDITNSFFSEDLPTPVGCSEELVYHRPNQPLEDFEFDPYNLQAVPYRSLFNQGGTLEVQEAMARFPKKPVRFTRNTGYLDDIDPML